MTELDRTCLSYWFPRLVYAGVPVPKTEIVHWPGECWALMDLCYGKEVPGFWGFVAELREAADRVGRYPIFLRTGQGSGKHDWKNTCHVPDAESLPHHVAALVEWSHMVDMIGLKHDVWVVREMLPTEPLAVCKRYGDFPLVREVRCFIRGGRVICWHPYWPRDAVEQGRPDGSIEAIVAEAQRFDLSEFMPLAEKVALALADDGAWSVDLLPTRNGWYVTDMAVASRSFHWEGCGEAKSFQEVGE